MQTGPGTIDPRERLQTAAGACDLHRFVQCALRLLKRAQCFVGSAQHRQVIA